MPPWEKYQQVEQGPWSKYAGNQTATTDKISNVSPLGDVAMSAASGVGRGLTNLIDLGGALVAKGADIALDKTGVGDAIGWKTGVSLQQYMQGGGLNTLADAVLGEQYQPQTMAGEAAKAAGSAVGTLPLGGAGAVSSVGNIGRAAASGIAGYGGSEAGGAIGEKLGGETGRQVGQIAGGLAGGVAGAYTPEIVKAVASPVIRRVAGATPEIVKNAGQMATNVVRGRDADSVFADTISRSAKTPQQLKAELEAGEISSLADIAGDEVQGLTRAVAKTTGGKDIVADALENRSMDAVNRVSNLLSKKVSSVDTYFGNLDDIAKARSKVAAPLYDEAFKANKSVSSKSIDKILETPAGKRALGQAANKMQNDLSLMGIPDKELAEQAALAGVKLQGGAAKGLNLRSLDYVKRSFDDQIGEALRSGANDDVRILTGLKNNLIKSLDEVDITAKAGPKALKAEGGSYKRARETFSGFAKVKEAQEMGLDFTKMTPEQLRTTLKDMSADQVEAFKIGVRENLQKTVNTTPDGADPAKRIFGNTQKKQQLEAVFGKGDNFKQFSERLNEEIRAASTKQRVLGGSRTDYNMAADGEFGDLIQSVAQRGIIGTALNKAVDSISTGLAKRYYGINEKNAKALAEALTDRTAGIDALNRLIGSQKGRQKDILQRAADEMVPAIDASSSVNANPSPASNIARRPRIQLNEPNRGYDPEYGNIIEDQTGSMTPRTAVALGVGGTGMALATAKLRDTTAQLLKSEEDSRDTSYLDTRGFRTVGTGFNMDKANAKAIWKRLGIQENFDDVYSGKQKLSPESDRILLDSESNSALKGAKRIVGKFDKLGENQKAALASLAYQLGGEGLSKFKRTLKYLEEGNSKAVENSLLDSKLAREDSPARARRTALMLAYDLTHEEADRKLAEEGRIKPTERKYV